MRETKVFIDGKENIGYLTCRLFRKKPVIVFARKMDKAFEVHTLEGVMKGEPGDWLIRGLKGEFYPCKPDIFEATYEEVISEPEKS